MKSKKRERKDISIKVILISAFIILMLITVSSIGYVVFTNWRATALNNISRKTEDMHNEINHQINMFLQVPLSMNKVNKGLIEHEIINIENEIEREKYFVEILKSNISDVYSFSYGTELGEYYGARRNENNVIEIMRNNNETGGHSWYYSVTGDITAGIRTVDAGEFDPRTREWYMTAKEKKKLIFSPIYKHFVMDDLVISAAVPIYNSLGQLEGVLGTHIILSTINDYLKGIAKDENAYTLIIEKDSGELVANSFNMNNFDTTKDGVLERTTIHKIDNQAIRKAYTNYIDTDKSKHIIKDGYERLHIDITDYHNEELEWVVITAIPENLFMVDIVRNMQLSIIITMCALILSIFIYLKITKKYFSPADALIETTEKLTRGDLSQRAIIIRNDEIGKLSIAFNKMADTINSHVNNLEDKVVKRTAIIVKSYNSLKEKKEQLKLILDSTVEAIYGLDNEGKCTFCNLSGLKMLGYTSQDELIGKKIHLLIHHTYKDGRTMPLEECKIYKALLEGKGTTADDEVFFRVDGTSFDVEYHSYPQYKKGKVVGAVVTFTDNTERRKNAEHIEYLSYHDSLTGLYNRMFFEKEIKRIDKKEKLPISIIFGDANGLKLNNDIFGHAAGDELLKKLAEVMKKVCRANDIISRVGGDEFVILLPNTGGKDAEKIMERIRNEFSKVHFTGIKGSISLGYETKTRIGQKLGGTIDRAEEWMYKEKLLQRNTINSNMAETIIESLHKKSLKEKHHSLTISELCQNIGRAMNMPDTEIRKLKEAGVLHDIGKIVLSDDIIRKDGPLTEEELREMEHHPVVGYRILNLFDETLDLADGILNHHENWDGSGYPRGIKGEEIPIIGRVIAVAEAYDKLTDSINENLITPMEALNKLKELAGSELDPNIVDVLVKIISENL